MPACNNQKPMKEILMNKGDTVIFAQRFDPHEDDCHPDLIEVTFERGYDDAVRVSKDGRQHLVGMNAVFPNMPSAVKALALQAQLKADSAESGARHARWVANEWLRKLEALD